MIIRQIGEKEAEFFIYSLKLLFVNVLICNM